MAEKKAADREELKREIELITGAGNVLLDEPMSQHTTFRVGGCADIFVYVRNADNLFILLSFLKKENVPYYIIGNGSNLLVSDNGYRGVILCTAGRHAQGHMMPDDEISSLEDGMCSVRVEGRRIYAGAGALLHEVVMTARDNGLDNLTFAAGIPGTVGGALYMNAGAFGSEMSAVVESAEAIGLSGNVPVRLTLMHDDLSFGYRTSIAKEKKLYFTAATLKLSLGDKDAIRARIMGLTEQRREKQPLEYPSAGSAFKRPEGHFAGKLIMEAGLAGYRVGGAEVAEKHCGFVVNRGGATASDVYTLMRDVKARVLESSGVTLEPEILFLGEF